MRGTEEDDASLAPTCAICLGPTKQRAFLSSCTHRLQWVQVASVCPLCKSPIHYLSRLGQRYEVPKNSPPPVPSPAPSAPAPALPTIAVPASTTRDRWGVPAPHRAAAYEKHSGPFPTAAHRERQAVYERNLWAKPFGELPSIITEAMLQGRTSAWLTRELQALLEEEDVSLALIFVLATLQQKDPRSAEVRERLREILFDRADHFVHELLCFLSSNFEMITYDRLSRPHYRKRKER